MALSTYSEKPKKAQKYKWLNDETQNTEKKNKPNSNHANDKK